LSCVLRTYFEVLVLVLRVLVLVGVSSHLKVRLKKKASRRHRKTDIEGADVTRWGNSKYGSGNREGPITESRQPVVGGLGLELLSLGLLVVLEKLNLKSKPEHCLKKRSTLSFAVTL